MIPVVRNRGRCFHVQDLLQTIGRHKKKRDPVAGVYGHILSARACSMRDVQAIEVALALCRVSLVDQRAHRGRVGGQASHPDRGADTSEDTDT